ncbi:8311_t:CDS:2, partial [Racocetra persica]
MNDGVLPIRLIGTTDAAVVDRFSLSSRIPQNHIWVLFELKKSVNDSCLYQAMAELTADDFKSVYAVFAGKAVAFLQDNLNFTNQEQSAEELVDLYNYPEGAITGGGDKIARTVLNCPKRKRVQR